MERNPGQEIDDPLVGRLLDGRYLIGSRIARGGMATVYRAVDQRLERTVAVKVMHSGLGDDHDFATRFVREARAAARLSHPNVVAMHDQGQHGDTVFLVMEHVPGHTLRDVIRSDAPLSPKQALNLLDPVVSALAAAHQAGLIHRDIKPENVLISDGPEPAAVKVADFGLAKAISADTQHTATGGVLIGTVSYLAPELVVDGRADTRADVYAAGVMLFELLTGKRPHEGDSPIQVAYKHVHEDVPAPSSVVPGIPAYVDALVARATARDREHRSADARVLLHQLRRVRQAVLEGVTDDPELVADLKPPASTAVPEGPIREQYVEDTAADPLARADATEFTSTFDVEHLAHLAPDAVPPPAPARRPEQSPAPESEGRRRRRGPLLLALVVLLLAGVAGGAWWFGVARWTTTPAVLELRSAEAQALLEDAGLEVEVGEPEYSKDVGEGLVLRTDPGPGDRVLDGGSVTIVLSLGEELYPIPQVRGKSEDDAQALLTEHFTYDETVEVFSEKFPQGQAIRVQVNGRTIKAGQERPPSTRVSLVVSKGRRPIDVVDFTGKPLQRAQAWAARRKLTLSVEEDYSESVAEGRIISQSPADGTRFIGESVTVIVSQGPPLIEIPSVRGMGVDAATKRLEDLGFVVKTKNHFDSIGLGYVTSSNPSSGTDVPKGSTITLTVF